MARAIPALPVVPAEPRRFAPRLPILSGQGTVPADDVGHWRDMAREVNLSLATGNASVVFEQWWTDAQFHVNSGAFVFRTRVAIPPLSGYHTLVRLSVWGSTPAAGVVRFRGINAVSLVDIALPGVLAWTDSIGPAHLAVVFAGAPSYEEITIETTGSCQVDAIKMEYLDINTGGFWPALDDALPAGPVPGSAFGANPMDDAEVGVDKPLSSDVGINILNNLRDLEARERVYLNIAGFDPGLIAVDEVIGAFPHRLTVPVLAARQPKVELTVAVYSVGTGGAFDLYVQRSENDSFHDISAIPPGGDVATITIPATVAGWDFFTVELTGGRDFQPCPGYYHGLTTLAIRPEFALATRNVQSIAMWSR